MIQNYYERIFKCPESKLIKIFGLFSIMPEKIDLILMENLIVNKENAVVFDLKGSLVNRKIDIQCFPVIGKTLKDENFLEESIKIVLNDSNKGIITTLIEDFEFLYHQDIMDYSLLLRIDLGLLLNSKEIIMDTKNVTIGIIDILQKYTTKKKYEKKIKSIFYDSYNISSADPTLYYKRICTFLDKVFSF